MSELIPTRSVLVTDFGEFELTKSVADKIENYPRVKYRNPFADDDEPEMDVVDLNYPPMARYFRLVTEHMKRLWLADGA